MTDELPGEIVSFIAASPIPITVALPAPKDRALVAANAAFCALTGFAEAEVLGRDCRFLQGPETDPAGPAAMRRFFADDAAAQIRISIVNYRKDGRPFVNLVFLSKLRGADRVARFLVASQFDISHATRASAGTFDRALGSGVSELDVIARTHRLGVETSLNSIAGSVHAVAAAKLALADLEARAK